MTRINCLFITVLTGLSAGALPDRPGTARAQVPRNDACWTAPCPHHPWYCAPKWNMEQYGRQAAAAASQAISAQVQNGGAIERTIWNHHFVKGTAALHPSGLALLYRMARRSIQQTEFVVLIETAHDVEFTADNVDGYAQGLDELDAQRVRAVQQYLTKVLRRSDARVLLHNPSPTGMPATEATTVYRDSIQGAAGSLRKSGDNIGSPNQVSGDGGPGGNAEAAPEIIKPVELKTGAEAEPTAARQTAPRSQPADAGGGLGPLIEPTGPAAESEPAPARQQPENGATKQPEKAATNGKSNDPPGQPPATEKSP